LVMSAGVGYYAAARRAAVETPGSGAVAQVPESLAPQVVEAVQPPNTATPAPAPRGPRSVVTAVVNRLVPERATEAQLAVAMLNKDYDREIARLRTLIDQRRNQLDPVTVAIIERNMQVIDAAITECKKAIAKDPASRFLIEALNQSLQAKVELMRTAAQLPART